MAERARVPDHAALERALGALGTHIAYPPTPDLASTVRRRLAAEPARQSWWAALLPPQRSLAFVLLAAFVALGAVLALWPEARAVVADRLGLRGVRIEHLPFVPPPAATTVPAEPLGLKFNLGDQVSLDDAQARVPYRILTPALAELGPPDEVYVSQTVPDGQVALVYRARRGFPSASETGVGLLVTQFRAPPGSLDAGILGKGLGPETRVEQVVVNGGRGLWIEGRPHALFLRDVRGNVLQETLRLAGNVLLWEQGELTLRLEAVLSKEDALRVAASVR